MPLLQQPQRLPKRADHDLIPMGGSGAGCGAYAPGISRGSGALLEEARGQAITRKILFGHTVSVVHLSEAYLHAGQMDEATEVARQAVHLARDYERGNGAYALRLLGDIAAHQEPLDVDEAEAHYREALSLAEELGMRPLQAHCHRGLGMLYATIGQQEQARAELSAAIRLYRAMDMTFWLPRRKRCWRRWRDSKGAYGHAGKVLALRQWETGEPL